jgi:hypothetical protein
LETPQKLTYFGQSALSAVLCGIKGNAPLMKRDWCNNPKISGPLGPREDQTSEIRMLINYQFQSQDWECFDRKIEGFWPALFLVDCGGDGEMEALLLVFSELTL